MVEATNPQDVLPRKRHRAESVYPRVRSVTACTLCRGRKTKCDNTRPSCGFCLSIQAHCVYDDTRSDFSNYDSASLHIIDRLERLGERMEQGFRDLSSASDPSSPTHEDTLRAPETRLVTSAPIPVAETILEWGIFDNLAFGPQGRSLALVNDLEPDLAYSPPSATDLPQIISNNREPYEESFLLEADINAAVHRFIENVHSKNPILELGPLREAANNCQSKGFGTDNFSALVAIACALGYLANPYIASPPHSQSQQMPKERDTDRRIAHAFFTKARVIMSLLPSSLLTIQCLFFCGVYEMYSIRPVAAWLDFSQASVQLRLQLLSRPSFSLEEFDSSRGRLIQRLYWSCMQSECELANELRLKSSGLEDLQFPHAFPAPPVEPAIHNNVVNDGALSSWLYYLSETSLRRICDDVAWTLYKQPPTSWIKDVALMRAHAERLEGKIEAWMANLPHILLVGSRPSESTNELGLHIRSRYLQCRSWIFRPFLYIMVHATPAMLSEHRKDIEPLAYACLTSCMDCINDVTFHHRHHGTWYMVRVAFASALLLLAAAKARFVSMPPNWRDAIRRTLIIVNRWNTDCKNLQVSAKILEVLRQQTQE